MEPLLHNEDLGSEFEFDAEEKASRKKRRHDLADKAPAVKTKLPKKQDVTTEYDKEEGKVHRLHLISLDAYARHKKFINDYLMFYGGDVSQFKRDSSRDKRDIDVIREHHQFLWEDEDEADASWEKRLAKKYFDKLFKEYCISDLMYYKENKIAMRWRTEKEVIAGKGQFICGDKRCNEEEELRSWEVNFGYVEHGEKKNALVKLRLCPDCSYKLNYRHRRREIVKASQALAVSHKNLSAVTGDTEDTDEPHSPTSASLPANSQSTAPPATAAAADSGGGDVWSGPQKVTEDKSRDDEFNDYFEDMFL